MIDSLATWQSTLAALPKVADASWSLNFANWYANRIVNIQPNQTILNTAAGFTFTFPTSTFASQLATLTPTTNQLSGVTGFANAWAAAMTLIVFPVSLSVSAGAFVGISSPPTLFSTVTATVLDPASIAAGKAKILELATAPVVSDPLMSEFAEKFRDATLLLTITVTGLNSVPPPPGPQPLVAPTIPLT